MTEIAPPLLLALLLAPVLVIGALGALIWDHRQQAALRTRLQRTIDPARTAPGAATPGASAPRLVARAAARLRQLAHITAERVSIMGGADAEKSADLLITAGLRGRDALVIHAFVKTVVPLLGLVLTTAALLWRTPLHAIGARDLALVLAIALALSLLPDILLRARRARRLARIRRAVPDVLELLVVTSEAGLGAQASMRRVAREMREAAPELAEDLQILVFDLSLAADAGQAYQRFARAVPLPEVAVFVRTLEQAERYGTPFSSAMRRLVEDLRSDRLLRIEEKAARLPAVMTLPLVAFLMPAIFIVILGPAVLSLLDGFLGGG